MFESDCALPRWVLLIHGTGAADPSDAGPNWWQRDSTFWTDLNRQLSPRVLCAPPEAGVFHWSGLNSEKARRAAGRSLYERLRSHDESGREYHVVAHSHGGSVMWHALIESMAAKRPLRGLQTWTTVGTPFLHYRVDRHIFWSIVPLLAALAGAIASFPQMRALSGVWTGMIDEGFFGSAASLILLWSLTVLVLVLSLTEIIRGTYAYVDDRRRNDRARAAWQAYSSKWSAAWSVDDEAINGLASTLAFRGEIMPRAKPFGVSILSRAGSFLLAPFRFFYNAFLARLGDQFIWDRVTKRLQGTDIAAARLASVSRAPLKEIDPPGLPAALREQLRELANEQAAKALQSIRAELSAPDKPGLLERFQKQISWNELIHTSYFDILGVRELIAQSILRGTAQRYEARTFAAPPMRDGGSGALLPFAVAVALIALIGAAQLFSRTIYENSVETFSDAYQVAQVVRDAPLEDAAVGMYGRQNDEALTKWVTALLDSGHFNEAIQVTWRFADTMGTLTAGLLLHGRIDLVRGLIERPEHGLAERAPDCAIAEAVGLLATKQHLREATKAVDLLAARTKENVSHDCAGTIPALKKVSGYEQVSGREAAVDGSRAILALAMAESKESSAIDIFRLCNTITDESRRDQAVEAVMGVLVKRGEGAEAFAGLSAIPTSRPLNGMLLASLAVVLVRQGKPQEAAQVAERAVATRYNGVVAKLVEGRLLEQIFRSEWDDFGWNQISDALLEKNDFENAEKAALRIQEKKTRDEALVEIGTRAIARDKREVADRLVVTSAPGIAAAYAEAGRVVEAIAAARLTAHPIEELDWVVDRAKAGKQRLIAAEALIATLRSASAEDRLIYLPKTVAVMVSAGRRKDAAALAQWAANSAGEIKTPTPSRNSLIPPPHVPAIDILIQQGFVDDAWSIDRAAGAGFHEYDSMDDDPIAKALANGKRLDDTLKRCREVVCGVRVGEMFPPLSNKAAALAIASKLRNDEDPHGALIYLVRCNLLADARAMMSSVPNDVSATMAGGYALQGDVEAAIRAALSGEDRQQTLLNVMRIFLKRRNLTGARRAAEILKSPEERTKALRECAKTAQKTDERRVLLEAALAASEQGRLEGEKLENRCKIATELARNGDYRRARLLSAPCPAPRKLETYTALVETYTRRNTISPR